MDAFLRSVMYIAGEYAFNKFIEKDFAQKYDEKILFEYELVNLTLALASGIEKIKVDLKCIEKVILLLNTRNVEAASIDLPKHFLLTEEFIKSYSDFTKLEYEYRYCFVESLLFILYYNEKNIKNYPDIIKIARFLELKKDDFIYLVNKYKGELK